MKGDPSDIHTTIEPTPIAKILAKRRRLLTAQELAKEIGVSRNTIGKMERDPLSVKGATLRKYLLLLGWRLRFAKDFRHDGPEGLHA